MSLIISPALPNYIAHNWRGPSTISVEEFRGRNGRSCIIMVCVPCGRLMVYALYLPLFTRRDEEPSICNVHVAPSPSSPPVRSLYLSLYLVSESPLSKVIPPVRLSDATPPSRRINRYIHHYLSPSILPSFQPLHGATFVIGTFWDVICPLYP